MYEQDKEWNVEPIRSKEQAGPPVALNRLVGRLRSGFWRRIQDFCEWREDAAYDVAQRWAYRRKRAEHCRHEAARKEPLP